MDDLIHILKKEKASCVIQKDGQILVENGSGLQPLMAHLRKDRLFFQGTRVADKVVGKAAAMLLIASGANWIYGTLMSESAIAILQRHAAFFAYGEEAPYIQNRTRTGMCPLEESVAAIEDPKLAFDRLEVKIQELMRK